MTARLLDDTFARGLETARLLLGHPKFSPELADAIRRNGGADKAVRALYREFGLAYPITSLEDMIADCGINTHNVVPEILDGRYGVRPWCYTDEGSRLYSTEGTGLLANRDASVVDDLVSALDEQGLESDPIEKLLAYAKTHPNEIGPVFALGSSMVDGGSRYTPFIIKRDSGFVLGLHRTDRLRGWGYPATFLVSPEKV